MASRIVVMRDGWIQQVGAPKDIYDNPANVFVGGFIGTPPMNFINGRVGEDGVFECGNQKYGVVRLAVPEKQLQILKDKNFIDKDVILGIRPEAVFDKEEEIEKYPQWTIEEKVDVSELLGAESQITVKLPGTDRAGQRLTAKVAARVDIHMGDTMKLALNMNKCHFFDPEGERQPRITRD